MSLIYNIEKHTWPIINTKLSDLEKSIVFCEGILDSTAFYVWYLKKYKIIY